MARRDKDFLGLEVVSLEDASVVGEVDGLIVDEKTNAVAGLIIDLGIYEAKVLAYSDVLNVGDDAVMIDSAGVVKPISQHSSLKEIAERDIDPCDSLAITDKGDIVGVVGDYFVDPASGALKGVEVVVDEEDDCDEGTVYVLPMADVVRIGADLLMVRAGFQANAVSSGEDL